jgi:hypothetical protein
MKLEKWALISEIVSAAAVVIALIFLILGLRDNTRALEAATRQGFAAQDQVYLATVLDPSVLAQATAKRESGQTLSDLEASQLVHRQHLNFRVFEHAYYQYQRRSLEEREWKRYEEIIDIVLSDEEAARRMWEVFRTGFTEEFRQLVDSRLLSE